MALAVFFLLTGLEAAILSLVDLPYAAPSAVALLSCCAVRLALMWPAYRPVRTQPQPARVAPLYADRPPVVAGGA